MHAGGQGPVGLVGEGHLVQKVQREQREQGVQEVQREQRVQRARGSTCRCSRRMHRQHGSGEGDSCGRRRELEQMPRRRAEQVLRSAQGGGVREGGTSGLSAPRLAPWYVHGGPASLGRTAQRLA